MLYLQLLTVVSQKSILLGQVLLHLIAQRVLKVLIVEGLLDLGGVIILSRRSSCLKINRINSLDLIALHVALISVSAPYFRVLRKIVLLWRR